MTVPEVAQRLGVSKRTVWRLLASGQLPRVRVGRAVRIPKSAVLRYITSVTTTTPLPA